MATMLSDFMNDVLTSATLGTVGPDDFGNKDSRGGKVYLSTKLACTAMARECIRWSYKELVATATLLSGTNTVAPPEDMNPNYIQDVWISGGALTIQKRLRMTTYFQHAKNILEVTSDATIPGTPRKWYILKDIPYFYPYADSNYTLHFLGQGLPLRWNASESNTTELDIPVYLEDVLHEMSLWRLQRIERGGEYKETKYFVEDMTNKDSLLYKAIFANKLPVKKRLKRWRFGRIMNPYNYL